MSDCIIRVVSSGMYRKNWRIYEEWVFVVLKKDQQGLAPTMTHVFGGAKPIPM